MRSRLRQLAIVVALATASLFGQSSYRGISVGQRGDFLPPQFSEVKTGEFAAQLGNDRIVAEVNGALVTDFRVIPLIPLTLAEAVARHGSIPNIPRMLTILDGYGESQGIADPILRIAYITSTLSPDSVISYVGYYGTPQALMTWLGNPPSGLLTVLELAAKNVSLQEVNERPRVGSPEAAAQYMVTQAIKAAQTQGQDAWALVKEYAQSCSNTPECVEARRKQLDEIRRAGDKYHALLVRAEDSYEANAALLNGLRPAELDRQEQLWKELIPKVREFLADANK